jgi:hypothetical protein
MAALTVTRVSLANARRSVTFPVSPPILASVGAASLANSGVSPRLWVAQVQL